VNWHITASVCINDDWTAYSLDTYNNQAPRSNLKFLFTSDESGQNSDRYIEGSTGSFSLQAGDSTTYVAQLQRCDTVLICSTVN
jgi:hypothetical protein